jgi:hypothetical protein
MTICSICTKCSCTLSKCKWISLKSINESFYDAPRHFLKDSNASPKVEIMEKGGVGVHSLACKISRVKGHAGTPGWGLGRVTSGSIIHTVLHKLNNKLVSVWLEYF